MDPKKSKNKQVERHSGLYTEIGLLVALLLIFSAFKWNASPPNYTLPEPIEQEEEEFLPPSTDEVVEKPKQPEPKPEPIVKEVIKPSPFITFVSNEVNVEFDSSLFNLELDDITDDVLYGDGMLDSLEEPVAPYELNQQPSFPGGQAAYYEFIRKNAIYPKMEKDYGIGGTVHLKFQIDKKGRVTNVEVAKGATPNLDAEALRVARSMPNWNPGIKEGKAVNCYFYQKIVFRTKH